MDGRKGLYMAETKPASLARTFWLYGVGYLSILYLTSFLAVYTPIGRTLGVPMHRLPVLKSRLGRGRVWLQCLSGYRPDHRGWQDL